MDKITYREGEIPLGEVKKQHEAGHIHICSVCGEDLLVVFSDSDMEKTKLGKGVFCPRDLKHVNVRIMGRRKKLDL